MTTDHGMIYYEGRLSTFKNWPFHENEGATCTAEKMAEVGFFCPNPVSEPDSTRCFVCRKELDGWEPQDSPLAEHTSHSSKCEFLKLGCKKTKDLTVEQLLKIICKSWIVNFVEARAKQKLKKFDQQASDKLEELENIELKNTELK